MNFALALVVTLFLFSAAVGQTNDDKAHVGSKAQQGLRDLVNKWNEAEVRGDAIVIDRLLAKEFSFLGGSDKAQYLSLMKPDPSLIIESVTVEDQSVEIYGGTAIVTGLNNFKVKKDGQALEGKFLSMTVWVMREGRWQCVKACTHPVNKK